MPHATLKFVPIKIVKVMGKINPNNSHPLFGKINESHRTKKYPQAVDEGKLL